jgi:hypothetical protein
MRRRIRHFTLITLAMIALATAGSSPALASCLEWDLACHVAEAVGAGGAPATSSTGPLDTPVDELVDPVVDPVIGTVKPIVDDVTGRAPDLPGGGRINPPDLGGGGGKHVGGPPAGDEPRNTPNPDVPNDRALGGRGPDGPGLSGLMESSAGDPSGTTRGVRPEPTASDRFRAALGGVARSLAIVLALFGLAVAFVTLQDRLDRSDPRLALAPVESDVVEFA